MAEDKSPPGKSVTLRVKKAHERDAGRFIIRIDSSTMEKLGVQTGDILGIKGRKQTAGIVWPAYPQDEGQSIIRMDGRMRRNAGVSLEENLAVHPVQERPGLSVTLAPLEMRFPVKDFDDFVKQKLLNCPVVKDDTVHVSILGRPVRFLVRRSRPTGVVLIALNTQITILSEPPKELDVGVPLITYEEIGGLDYEIQRIREMVELPLKHPELFARLGINPPKGVLLFGPPGCGKTLLAQAVANESEAHFISINGPEIMSKFYGESEKRLRQIFDEAEKNAPSIIFIDELDAIAPKREEVIGEVERRVVAQLLAVMDGLQQRGQVIVIGASVTGETPILVKDAKGTRLVPIGEYVDSFYENGEADVEKPVQDVYTLGFTSRITDTNFGNQIFERAEFKSVQGVFRHKVNEIYEIVFTGGKIRATGNHSVFVRTRRGVEAKPVTELNEGDFLVDLPYRIHSNTGLELRTAEIPTTHLSSIPVPILGTLHAAYEMAVESGHDNEAIIDVKSIAAKAEVDPSTVYRWQKGSKPRLLKTPLANSISSNIEVTPSFLKLLGYYAAEGYARKEVDFCFGTHEVELIAEVKHLMHDCFGVKPSKVKVTGSRTNIIYYSKILASFLSDLCGSKSSNKHVPPMLFELPKEFFLAFLEGTIAGDGYITHRGRIQISSVSKRFITELNWLCRMHGIKSNTNQFTARERKIGKHILSPTIIFRLSISAGQNPFSQKSVKRVKIHRAKITSITKKPFDGFVYDLCGCDNEAFFGGETPVLLHNSNRPNAIDPALRRPGRFDREVEIRVPDKEGRHQIIHIHSRGMPLESVEPEGIADITHGFVGADLAALCREAAMNALRRYLPRINLEEDEIPPEVLADLRVTNDDFMEALREIQPTAMREVTIEVPNVRWSDVGGLEVIKHKLQQAVQWPLQHPESFTRLGVEPPRGVLLYGPPGCGKTMLARAVATESEANFISIKGPEVLCVAHDTPIISSHCGLRTIEQLYEQIKLNGDIHSTKNCEIVTPSEIIEVPAMNEEGKMTLTRVVGAHKLFVKEAYTLQFSNNSTIEVSANQPFYSFRNNELQWIKTHDLKENDWIAVPSHIPTFNQSLSLQIPPYSHLRLIREDAEAWYVRIFSTHSETRLPKILSVDLAEFLGWFAAEGNITKGTVSVSNYSKDNRERIKNLFEVFIEAKRIKENKSGLLVHSAPLKKFLEQIFEMPLKAKTYTIRVPPIMFKAASKQISAFLRGVWKGDGTIRGTQIEYSSSSKELAQGIIYLLSLLDVKAKFWKRRDGMHIVTISGKKEMTKFRNSVFHENQDEKVRRHFNARYPIPDVSKLLKEAKEELKLTYGKQLPDGLCEPIISGRKRCGLIRFKRIMKYIEANTTQEFRGTKTYNTLKKLSSAELAWVKVKTKKRSTPKWMYDIETELSSFVGGRLPLLLHNSKWVGESEKAIREVFRRARHAAPAIIFFDEIDAIAPARGTGAGDSHVTERVISQFLTEIDGIQSLKDIVVLAATNRPDLLDPAMLRPGRFDRHILVSAPDEKARKQIFEIYTRDMPITKDVKIEELVRLSENFAGSDIAACCREAALAALEESMESKKVTRKHFLKAIDEINPTITPEMEKAYLSWGKQAGQTRPSTSPFV